MGKTRGESNKEKEIERKARKLHKKWVESGQRGLNDPNDPSEEWGKIDNPEVEKKFREIHDEWLWEHREEFECESPPPYDLKWNVPNELSDNKEAKIGNEDILQVLEWMKPYAPLLSVIRFTAEKYGEAEVLKVVVGTEVKKYLRDLIDLFFYEEMDYENMDAGTLAQQAESVALVVTPIFQFKGVPDLGETVPPEFFDYLLQQPNPLGQFCSILFFAEHFRLLCAELDRRVQEHPELESLCKYSIAKGVDEEKQWGGFRVFLPDEFQRSEAFEEIRKMIEPSLSPKLWNYMHNDEDANSEGVERLWQEVERYTRAIEEDYPKVIVDGLKGMLKTSLRDETQRGIDAQRKRESRHRDKETPEANLPTTEDGKKSPLELIANRQGRETNPFEGFENREILNDLIRRAKLPKREQMVLDLTCEEKSDREIALALKKAFGKEVSEGNVRKLRHDAEQKLREFVATTE
jgi:hypothetical protein